MASWAPLLPSIAHAGEPWLTVDRAPPAAMCPSASDLQDAVENEPQGRAGPASAQSKYAVRIDSDRELLIATITVTGDNAGTRTISDADATCGGLSKALAVTLAILLDEERRTREEARRAAEAAIPSHQDSRVTPAPAPLPMAAENTTPPVVRAPPPRTVRLALALGGGAAVGLGPSATGAVLADVFAGVGRFGGGVSGSFVPPTESRLGPGGVDVSVATLVLRGCGTIAGSRAALYFDACADLGVGAVFGAAHGYDTNKGATRPFVAAGLGAEVGATLVVLTSATLAGPLGWFVRADGLFPVRGQGFDVSGVGQVYTPSAGGALVTAGIRFTFP